MKKLYTVIMVATLGLLGGTAQAAQETGNSPESEAARKEVQAMLEEAERVRAEAERTRQEAEQAREEAARASEQARELARRESEQARELARLEAEQAREAAHGQAERARQAAEETRRYQEESERELALQREEVERAREELSRAHRELREASREVARAHRELSRTGEDVEVRWEVNLGDRAVIGVVLGGQTPKGVEIVGVSPDGPAERAGLQPGDTLVSIRGIDLVNNDEARQNVFSIMQDVSDGEELAVTVDRDGETWDYTVTAERREPSGWQSVVRIPDEPVVVDSPDSVHTIVETLTVSDIDEAGLAAQIADLSQRLESREFTYVTKDGKTVTQQFEFGDFSDFGDMAMNSANAWFGLPQANGLELTSINPGLGAYFKTDRGVLVIKAREDNAYELESGDVILSIGDVPVNSPSDLVRALRDVEPESAIDIAIKRHKKDRTLKVTVPENRLGFR